jgi:hypothetical protein
VSRITTTPAVSEIFDERRKCLTVCMLSSSDTEMLRLRGLRFMMKMTLPISYFLEVFSNFLAIMFCLYYYCYIKCIILLCHS